MDKRDTTYKNYCERMVKEIEIEYVIEGLKQRGLQIVPMNLPISIKPKQDDNIRKSL